VRNVLFALLSSSAKLETQKISERNGSWPVGPFLDDDLYCATGDLVWKNDKSSCRGVRCRAVHARSASAVAHRIAIRASIKNQCKRSGVVSQGWGVAKVGCKNSNLPLSNTRHLLPSLLAPSRR
jgi:hypothetical protein